MFATSTYNFRSFETRHQSLVTMRQETTVMSLQQLLCRCSNCYVTATTVMSLQQLLCRCNNCSVAATTVMSLQKLLCRCNNCYVEQHCRIFSNLCTSVVIAISFRSKKRTYKAIVEHLRQRNHRQLRLASGDIGGCGSNSNQLRFSVLKL